MSISLSDRSNPFGARFTLLPLGSLQRGVHALVGEPVEEDHKVHRRPPPAVSYDVTLRSLVLRAHHPVHSRDVTTASGIMERVAYQDTIAEAG